MRFLAIQQVSFSASRSSHLRFYRWCDETLHIESVKTTDIQRTRPRSEFAFLWAPLYVFVAGGAVFDPEVDDRLAKRLKEKYNPDRSRDQRPSDEALEVSRAVVSFGWAQVGTLPHPV